MSYAFIPQQPSKYDKDTRLWIPIVDIQQVEQFGTPVVMIPPNAGRGSTAPLVDVIKAKMRDYTIDDYIVALGDPSLIAAAACIAAKATGGVVKMLKWDRVVKTYISVEVVI